MNDATGFQIYLEVSASVSSRYDFLSFLPHLIQIYNKKMVPVHLESVYPFVQKLVGDAQAKSLK